MLRTLLQLARRLAPPAMTRPGPCTADPARTAELWCRPAIVLVLRDRKHAGTCVAGWH